MFSVDYSFKLRSLWMSPTLQILLLLWNLLCWKLIHVIGTSLLLLWAYDSSFTIRSVLEEWAQAYMLLRDVHLRGKNSLWKNGMCSKAICCTTAAKIIYIAASIGLFLFGVVLIILYNYFFLFLSCIYLLDKFIVLLHKQVSIDHCTKIYIFFKSSIATLCFIDMKHELH